MKTYVVLLRGINVGGKNIVPMKPLVSLLSSHGFQQVKYYIQSGNLVLKANDEPSDKIKSLIQGEFNVNAEIISLTVPGYQQAIANCPFLSEDGKTIHFFFCKTKPAPDIEKLESFKSETEQYHLTGHVFYLYAPDGIGRSKLATKVDVCLNTQITARNLNTIKKVDDLLNKD